MAVIVIDASVLVVALVDNGPDGRAARDRLLQQHEGVTAPELVDLEVASALRSLARSGSLPEGRALAALTDLTDLPLVRVAHAALLPRCWELRNNLTVYDAAYVALAEALDAVLVTADVRLAQAPGVRCEVEVLESG